MLKCQLLDNNNGLSSENIEWLLFVEESHIKYFEIQHWEMLPVKKYNPVENIENCKEYWKEDEEEEILASCPHFVLQ